MTVTLIVVAALLGVAAAGSAIQKLRRDTTVVASMHAVGVTDRQIPLLAILELLGALGLLIGIWWPPVGIAAAVGLTAYFLGAVLAHIRSRSGVGHALPAMIILILAIATTILEVSR